MIININHRHFKGGILKFKEEVRKEGKGDKRREQGKKKGWAEDEKIMSEERQKADMAVSPGVLKVLMTECKFRKQHIIEVRTGKVHT